MKMKTIGIGFVLLTIAGALWATNLQAAEEDQKASGPYRHVVLFGFKETSSAEDVAKIEKDFAALKEKIDLIVDYEWGTNVSPEGLADGLTHCFFVTFKDKKALEAYLPHPAHQSFVAGLKPHLEKVVVVDYVAGG